MDSREYDKAQLTLALLGREGANHRNIIEFGIL
jgi:hypothetical protein